MKKSALRRDFEDLALLADGLNKKIQSLGDKLNRVDGSASRKRDIDYRSALVVEKRNKKIKSK